MVNCDGTHWAEIVANGPILLLERILSHLQAPCCFSTNLNGMHGNLWYASSGEYWEMRGRANDEPLPQSVLHTSTVPNPETNDHEARDWGTDS